MNAASEWRLLLARRIATACEADPKVASVLLGGSVPKGYADRYSDLEIYVFWNEPPSDGDRTSAIKRAGGTLLRLYPYEPEEWSDEYLIDGVKVDGSHFTVTSIERMVTDVLERFDTSFGKQVLLSTFEHGIPFGNAAVVDRWRNRLKPYPDGLAEAMVREHIEFTPRWALVMLLERDDLLALYQRMCGEATRVLGVLLGLNRVYNPGVKWLDRLVSGFTVAPTGLARRLGTAFREPPAMGVWVLEELVEETLDLVDARMPRVDTAAARKWFREGRAPVGPA